MVQHAAPPQGKKGSAMTELWRCKKPRTKIPRRAHEIARLDCHAKAYTNKDFELYNVAHPQEPLTMWQEATLSNFYTPSEGQRNAELAFVSLGAVGLGFAAFHL